MLNIIDDLSENGNLHEHCLFVSFDVIIKFPSVDSKM